MSHSFESLRALSGSYAPPSTIVSPARRRARRRAEPAHFSGPPCLPPSLAMSWTPLPVTTSRAAALGQRRLEQLVQRKLAEVVGADGELEAVLGELLLVVAHVEAEPGVEHQRVDRLLLRRGERFDRREARRSLRADGVLPPAARRRSRVRRSPARCRRCSRRTPGTPSPPRRPSPACGTPASWWPPRQDFCARKSDAKLAPVMAMLRTGALASFASSSDCGTMNSRRPRRRPWHLAVRRLGLSHQRRVPELLEHAGSGHALSSSRRVAGVGRGARGRRRRGSATAGWTATCRDRLHKADRDRVETRQGCARTTPALPAAAVGATDDRSRPEILTRQPMQASRWLSAPMHTALRAPARRRRAERLLPGAAAASTASSSAS